MWNGHPKPKDRRVGFFCDHRRAGQPALTDPGLAAEDHPRRCQRAVFGFSPDFFEVFELALASDQRSARDPVAVPFGDDAVVLEIAFDALDGFGGQAVEFKQIAHNAGDGVRDRDAAGLGEAAHACG